MKRSTQAESRTSRGGAQTLPRRSVPMAGVAHGHKISSLSPDNESRVVTKIISKRPSGPIVPSEDGGAARQVWSLWLVSLLPAPLVIEPCRCAGYDPLHIERGSNQ